jgi:hypothetical protein
MYNLKELLGFGDTTPGENAIIGGAPLLTSAVLYKSQAARNGVNSFLLNSTSGIAGGDPLMLQNNSQNAGYMLYNKGANPRQFTSLGQNLMNSGSGDLLDDMTKGANSAAMKGRVNAHTSVATNNALGLTQGSKLTMGLSLGLTAYFGYDSVTQGGDNALRDFIFSEFAANSAGLKRAQNIINAKDGVLATHNSFLGLAGNVKNGYTNSMFMGQQMIGRMTPIIGGYAGAQLGIGLGEQLGKLVGNKYLGFREDSSVAGFVGAAIGAGIGANVGALAGSGFLTMAGVGIAIAGANEIANTTTNILKTGFKERRKRRGLDFANNSETMFTQYASTMRQRAFDAMSKSHLNARSALGNEAKLMYLDRDYYNSYRRI